MQLDVLGQQSRLEPIHCPSVLQYQGCQPPPPPKKPFSIGLCKWRLIIYVHILENLKEKPGMVDSPAISSVKVLSLGWMDLKGPSFAYCSKHTLTYWGGEIGCEPSRKHYISMWQVLQNWCAGPVKASHRCVTPSVPKRDVLWKEQSSKTVPQGLWLVQRPWQNSLFLSGPSPRWLLRGNQTCTCVSTFNVLDVSCVCVKKGGVCCRLDNGFSDCLDMHSVSGLWSV